MKQAVVISVLVVSLVSLALAQGESETQLKESERYNNALINGISNNYPQVASSPITTPSKLRQKRTTTPLRYNRDGTISIQCRFNPESCRNRRQRRDGKKLLSLYLKPPMEKISQAPEKSSKKTSRFICTSFSKIYR